MAPDTGNRAVVALFGREKVEDLELAQAARPDEPRDTVIEETGLAFSIATRLTSWVAVSETISVDPRDPTRRERIPQALPYGMSVEGLGLRRSAIGAAKGSGQAYGTVRGGGAAPSMPRSRGSVPLGGPPPRPSRGIPLGGPPPPSAGRPAAPPAAPPAARSAAPPPAAPSFASLRDLDDAPDTPADWRLEGRVVSTKDGVCILEIVAGAAGLAWNPEALGYVAITRLEGDDIAVRVDLARTTRAATLAAGEIARLALSFDGTPTQVSFEIMGRRVTVKLSA